jgi:hypothetical protein
MPIANAWPMLRRIGYALAGAVAWLALCGVFVLESPPEEPGRLLLAFKASLVAFGLLSLVRPAAALLVLAAFVTIAQPVAGQLGAHATRGAEALVLAFLGGWWFAGALRRRPLTRSRMAVGNGLGVRIPRGGVGPRDRRGTSGIHNVSAGLRATGERPAAENLTSWIRATSLR